MFVYLKSKEEIEKFYKSGKLSGEILSKLLKATKVGVTPNEINILAIEECKKAGVKPAFLGLYGFPAAVCISVNNNLVHGIPNDIPFEFGDVVSLDFGTDIGGFIGDTAETITVGKSNLPIVLHCQEALKRAIAVTKPGNTLGEISSAISQEKQFKIVEVFGGHGVCINKLHCEPFVSNVGDKNSNLKLRPGMVIAIEPMLVSGQDIIGKVLKDGWTVQMKDGITAHSEHTIAITENGNIVLTQRLEEE